MLKQMPAKMNTKTFEKLFFYTIKYTRFEERLCMMEMKYLFEEVPEEKHFFSDCYVDPSRSSFVKFCIEVLYICDTLDEMTEQILKDNLSYEEFKVCYINIDDSVNFDERRKVEYILGLNISGEADMHNPKVLLGVTKIHEKWILGIYERNKASWELHNKKPYTYSNGLGTRVAKALVNIAAGNDTSCRLIDPCCGIGTVLIEALSMGFSIKGLEINPYIAENAKKNLEFFGYENVVTHGDMHCITDKFDAAIVDLPYGVFSLTSLKEQVDIIRTTRKIADKAVIISFENMDKHIIECGFHIVDKCDVCKGRFIRYITICK